MCVADWRRLADAADLPASDRVCRTGCAAGLLRRIRSRSGAPEAAVEPPAPGAAAARTGDSIRSTEAEAQCRPLKSSSGGCWHSRLLFFALGWIAARIDIKHLLRESRALPLSYFRGLNFPVERAARQGDRVVHRGASRSIRRPSICISRLGNLFRAPGRDRSRDPHAPEPARPATTFAGRQAADWRYSSWRRIFIARGAARPGRGSVHQARRQPVRAPVAQAACCRSTSRKRTGQKAISADHAHGSAGEACRTSRKSPITTARWRKARCCARRLDEARRYHRPGAGGIQAVHARDHACSGDVEAQQGNDAAAARHWQRIESQNPAFLGLVADRLADAYRRSGDYRAGHSGAAQLRGPISFSSIF